MIYFKRFASEYLDNRPSSWDPNYDRKILAFSIVFTSGSMILARSIWSGETEHSWFLTLFCLSCIIVFSLINPFIFKLKQMDEKQKTKLQENTVIPSQIIYEEKAEDYSHLISEKLKVSLFEGLRKFNFIDDDMDREFFIEFFLKHPIVLNLKVPALREFYNLLLKHQPQLNVIKPGSFIKFFIKAKTGEIYNKKQFQKTACPTSDLSEELHQIFKNLDQ